MQTISPSSTSLYFRRPPLLEMARVYVGNLPIDIRERELDDLFYKYGRIREIDLKQPARPPAFAFIAFDDVRGIYFRLITHRICFCEDDLHARGSFRMFLSPPIPLTSACI